MEPAGAAALAALLSPQWLQICAEAKAAGKPLRRRHLAQPPSRPLRRRHEHNHLATPRLHLAQHLPPWLRPLWLYLLWRRVLGLYVWLYLLYIYLLRLYLLRMYVLFTTYVRCTYYGCTLYLPGWPRSAAAATPRSASCMPRSARYSARYMARSRARSRARFRARSKPDRVALPNGPTDDVHLLGYHFTLCTYYLH